MYIRISQGEGVRVHIKVRKEMDMMLCYTSTVLETVEIRC